MLLILFQMDFEVLIAMCMQAKGSQEVSAILQWTARKEAHVCRAFTRARQRPGTA